jgi:nicotinamide-nucleotide amidase
MKDVIGRALDRADFVITSGGLGPTQDDLTREVIAEVCGRRLLRDPGLLDQIDRRFRRRGMIMTPNNERQADIPEGAIPVENPNGTAPSFIVEHEKGIVYALPGVPHEMKWLFENEVVPYLRRRFDLTEVILSRVLKVADLGESSVDDRIGHLMASLSNPTVGVLAHPGQVDVRITAKSNNEDEARVLIDPVEAEVRELLGRHLFGTDEQTMEDVVGALLREKGITVAVYEDVTAGMVAERVLRAAGDRFIEGVVANGTASMKRVLDPSLEAHQLAYLLRDRSLLTPELARAIMVRSQADMGVAVHVVPEGDPLVENLGTGKTFMSVATASGRRNRVYQTAGRGVPDRTRASLNALDLLRTTLLEH